MHELERGALPKPKFQFMFVGDATIVCQLLICSLWGKVVVFEDQFDDIKLVCLIPCDAASKNVYILLLQRMLRLIPYDALIITACCCDSVMASSGPQENMNF